MDDFDLPREIERYAQDIARTVRRVKARRAVTREYIEHLEDATYRYMIRGMTDAEALRRISSA